MTPPWLTSIPDAALDPIYAVWQQYKQDPNPQKVDLSIGAYHFESGIVEKLETVRHVEQLLFQERQQAGKLDSPDYLPIEGSESFCAGSRRLLFGNASPAVKEDRVCSVQSVGSTGALRYCAELLRRFQPSSPVYLSKPTWGNHILIFERTGFNVHQYPYYNEQTHSLYFEELIQCIKKAPAHSIFLLQPSCHNPTGCDPTPEQWREIIRALSSIDALVIFDAAYQGLGEGMENDASAVKEAVKADLTVMAAQSFSKTMSLYNRRTGALHVITPNTTVAQKLRTQIKSDIRSINSSCPADGSSIASRIFEQPELLQRWIQEVHTMRERIVLMRSLLVQGLEAKGLGQRFRHMLKGKGLFSYSGLTREEVLELRSRYSIYALESGRICAASFTKQIIPYIVSSIAAVTKQ